MDHKGQNRLAGEKSPYLLQHADNPVDWYPWGDEAFEKAAREDKPIFLSVGYSTCHWCHVMAHESFEDPRVAGLMNDVFVSIKVDREERPDIDMLYMTVCQMMTGSGGWPLTVIMTPDRQPFFAGTYIPRETRFGRVGLLELIPRIKEVWATRRAEVLSSAGHITEALRQSVRPASGGEPDEETLRLAFRQLRDRFDGEQGGFGGAPKFPTPHNLLFLLRYWKRSGEGQALDMVEATLQAMRRSGIFDQIGFGFHRYATDRRWLVPHFEKMLYDQALLATAYIEAFQATGKDEYARTAREVFEYVLRDMKAPGGGFYSAEDADSEGEEGKFYLWTDEEIRRVLAPEEADLFARVFNIKEGGNFAAEGGEGRTGRNIPHLAAPLHDVAAGLGMTETGLRERLEPLRRRLFAHREPRVHPHQDDKVLTDWNGLMVAALARGARVFEEAGYTRAAAEAVDFIFANMVAGDGRLLHRYRDGEAAVPAHLDDYAFLVHGLLEMYETTFEVDYLDKALALNAHMLAHFRDRENGGFYFAADDDESLLVRQKEVYDGAVPSGNSVAMLNLLRLAGITGDAALEESAAAVGRAFYGEISQSPSGYTQLMAAVDFAVGPSHEVVIAGDPNAEDTAALLRAVRRAFVPNKVVIFHPAGGEPKIERIAPFVKDQTPIDGKAAAYVCRGHKCLLPTTEAAAMLERLQASRPELSD